MIHDGLLVALICPRPIPPHFLVSLLDQEWPAMIRRKIVIPVVTSVLETRNEMIWEAENEGFEYLLLWDCSIVAGPSCAHALYSIMHGNPDMGILSAVCPTPTTPPQPEVYRPNFVGDGWKVGEVFETDAASLDMAIIRVPKLHHVEAPIDEYRWQGGQPNMMFVQAPTYFSAPETGPTIAHHPPLADLDFALRFKKTGEKWYVSAAAQTICTRVDIERKVVYTLPPKTNPVEATVCELGAGRGNIAGCQLVNQFPGSVTVDHNPDAAPDYCCDVRFLPQEWADRFEKVRASHVLEHLPYGDTDKALVEWVRILKPGGEIEIGVPDILATSKVIVGGMEMNNVIQGVIYGDQRNGFWKYPQDNGLHQSGFTPDSLKGAMLKAGLTDVNVVTEGLAMVATAKKPVAEETNT